MPKEISKWPRRGVSGCVASVGQALVGRKVPPFLGLTCLRALPETPEGDDGGPFSPSTLPPFRKFISALALTRSCVPVSAAHPVRSDERSPKAAQIVTRLHKQERIDRKAEQQIRRVYWESLLGSAAKGIFGTPNAACSRRTGHNQEHRAGNRRSWLG